MYLPNTSEGKGWFQMKHTGMDIWETVHVIMGYNSQLPLERNETKHMEQTAQNVTGSEKTRLQ